MEVLPIVPFGKHKGEPITELMKDTAYLEWCKQTGCFKKYPVINNICVNQTITTNNNNSKTPQHNKLQNLFLNNENQKELLLKMLNFDGLKKLFVDDEFIRCFGINNISEFINTYINKVEDISVIFEDKFNWDLGLYYLPRPVKIISFLEIETQAKATYKLQYDIEEQEKHNNEISLYEERIRVREMIDKERISVTELEYNVYLYGKYEEYKEKIKYPFLEPCKTLKRKLQQIKEDYIRTYEEKYEKKYKEYRTTFYNDLLKKYIKPSVFDVRVDENNVYSIDVKMAWGRNVLCCEIKPTLSDDYPCVLRKLKTQIELTNVDKGYFQKINKKYVLIIGSFTSNNTSVEQLISIFNQTGIKIVFIHELVNKDQCMVEDNRTIQMLETQNTNRYCQLHDIPKENKSTTLKPSIEVEQINTQLQEENAILKIQLLEAHQKITQLEKTHLEYDRWLKYRDEEIKRMLLSNKNTLHPRERIYNKDTMLDLKDVTYLEIPFQSKEEFKKYFGKWDRKNNLRYIDNSKYTSEIKEFILTYMGYEVIWKLDSDCELQNITNINVDNKINQEDTDVLLIEPLETRDKFITRLQENIKTTNKYKSTSKSIKDYFGK